MSTHQQTIHHTNATMAALGEGSQIHHYYKRYTVSQAVARSLMDTTMMTAGCIILIPAALLSWFGPLAFTIWCVISIIAILADSATRLRFFATECRWDGALAFLCLLFTMISTWVELLCLLVFLASGQPSCECLVAVTVVLCTFARALHRWAAADFSPWA
ncbi:hypothetical protein F5Y19DRAFT_431332 [Xylariaceae sp. FL1651]|nr:hypothetical protein F5Y19DRAFT_431332 [Xylariaceae sp. FL1651]